MDPETHPLPMHDHRAPPGPAHPAAAPSVRPGRGITEPARTPPGESMLCVRVCVVSELCRVAAAAHRRRGRPPVTNPQVTPVAARAPRSARTSPHSYYELGARPGARHAPGPGSCSAATRRFSAWSIATTGRGGPRVTPAERRSVTAAMHPRRSGVRRSSPPGGPARRGPPGPDDGDHEGWTWADRAEAPLRGGSRGCPWSWLVRAATIRVGTGSSLSVWPHGAGFPPAVSCVPGVRGPSSVGAPAPSRAARCAATELPRGPAASYYGGFRHGFQS